MTISLILNGTACHNTWNTTTGTDQHLDKAFSGKTKSAEDTVKDKCHTSHVSDLLQNGKHEEQY